MANRVTKKAEDRRLEILMATQQLFEHKGYVKTSVEDIIKQVGIAKGTFYYYFKSKQAILAALVEHLGEKMRTHFTSIVDQQSLTAIEKLQLMLRGDKKESISQSTVMDILHHPDNRELQQQLNIFTIEQIAPLIASVLEQGNQEGVFRVVSALETVQLILAGSQFVLDSGLFQWDENKKSALLDSLQRILETMLAVEPGTMGFMIEQHQGGV